MRRSACSAGFTLLFCLAPSQAHPSRDCPRIVSNLERLACFDEAAATPARVIATTRWSAPEQEAPSVMRVMTNEAGRGPEDLTFRLGNLGGVADAEEELVISAPAIASVGERSYLAISCIQNISRLQLITNRPVEASRVNVRIKGQGWSTSETAWQVRENGQVLDAGRGIPAIEQIKQMIGAQRIEVVSGHRAVDGLAFDAEGLDALISQVRRSCRW